MLKWAAAAVPAGPDSHSLTSTGDSAHTEMTSDLSGGQISGGPQTEFSHRHNSTSKVCAVRPRSEAMVSANVGHLGLAANACTAAHITPCIPHCRGPGTSCVRSNKSYSPHFRRSLFVCVWRSQGAAASMPAYLPVCQPARTFPSHNGSACTCTIPSITGLPSRSVGGECGIVELVGRSRNRAWSVRLQLNGPIDFFGRATQRKSHLRCRKHAPVDFNRPKPDWLSGTARSHSSPAQHSGLAGLCPYRGHALQRQNCGI
jgi:hypothetical protein